MTTTYTAVADSAGHDNIPIIDSNIRTHTQPVVDGLAAGMDRHASTKLGLKQRSETHTQGASICATPPTAPQINTATDTPKDGLGATSRSSGQCQAIPDDRALIPSWFKQSELYTHDERMKILAKEVDMFIMDRKLSDMAAQFAHLSAKLESAPFNLSKRIAKPATKLSLEHTQRPAIIMKPRFMQWRRFVNPTPEEDKEPNHLIEALTERPDGSEQNSLRRAFHDDAMRPVLDVTESQPGRVERFRIHSVPITEYLTWLLGGSGHVACGAAHIRPFKAILLFEQNLRDKYIELATSTATDLIGSQVLPDVASCLPTGAESTPHADIDQRTFAVHLKTLLDFMDTHLAADLHLHKRLQSDYAPVGFQLMFSDLWHLYTPGRKVYDHREGRAFTVVSVSGGRELLEQCESGSLFKQKAPPRPHIDNRSRPFIIACVAMESDGKCFGPVLCNKVIQPFSTGQDVKFLPLIPVEWITFAPDRTIQASSRGVFSTEISFGADCKGGQAALDFLQRRGEKFGKLSNPGSFHHREYSGFTLDGIPEQITGQVILDSELFHIKHPSETPELGMTEIERANICETKEKVAVRDWESGIFDRYTVAVMSNFEDRTVDDFLTKTFLTGEPELRSFAGVDQQTLVERYGFMFPRHIHGFVLPNRKWSALDVEHISDVKQLTQGFNDLVLPKEHRRIVEGLIKTHARDATTIRDGVDENHLQVRENLVRGKGKGLIMLLHGVPGVGKTSTAETVAEYTQRPLFALTCGDIGDNASDVQESLEQNFSLAHRWGCVMLIDEADVFLQARSKDDLKRNAVVSVFLRVLEYYSGILILTTNKVGTFDEAFRSRIHVSLYYQQLDRESTLQIWRNNLSRLAQSRTDLKIDEEKLMEWVEREWKRSEKQARNSGRRHRPWNGRQIHNACQTAAALAAFQAGTDDSSKGTLTTKNFNTVAKASREFDSYLQATHFADGIELAAKGGYRGDDAYNASEHQTNYPASMQNGFLPPGMRLGAYPQQPISQQHMGYQQQSTQDQSGRHQKNKQTRSRSGSRKVRASTKPAKSVKTAVHEVSNEEETGEDDDTVDDTDYSDDEE